VSATSGGTTTTIRIQYQNVNDSPGATPSSLPAGEIIEKVNGSAKGTGGSGQAVFELRNNGSRSVELVGIALNSTNSSATKVQKNGGNPEFSSNSTETAEYSGEMIIDGPRYNLSRPDTLDSNVTRKYEFRKFKDDSNGIDMRGKSVTITLYFDDGSSKQTTLDF
jgi:hypothetical protein